MRGHSSLFLPQTVNLQYSTTPYPTLAPHSDIISVEKHVILVAALRNDLVSKTAS